jgi:hypothetical protein
MWGRHRIIVIIIVIIMLLLLFIMQGIYSFIPETNHVYKVCSVAIILYLQFMLHVMLFRLFNDLYTHISTFRSMCAVHNMAVFYSSLISCFPVPVVPIIIIIIIIIY